MFSHKTSINSKKHLETGALPAVNGRRFARSFFAWQGAERRRSGQPQRLESDAAMRKKNRKGRLLLANGALRSITICENPKTMRDEIFRFMNIKLWNL